MNKNDGRARILILSDIRASPLNALIGSRAASAG
jgi:hypothetical protein